MENNPDDLKGLFEPSESREGYLSNFAILIPKGPMLKFEMVEDPLVSPYTQIARRMEKPAPALEGVRLSSVTLLTQKN